jgi:AGCS family alanine or glycine:cation symporter
VVYLVGNRGVVPYKIIYCLLIIVATLGFVTDDEQLDLWIGIGTGVMLFANIPIMLLLGHQAMKAYHDYMRRLKSGEMDPPHDPPPMTDVVEGKDVE